MKTLVTMLILGASIASHAAVYSASNSDCSARTGGGLTHIGDTNPKKPVPLVKPTNEKGTRNTANASSNWGNR